MEMREDDGGFGSRSGFENLEFEHDDAYDAETCCALSARFHQ